MVPGKVGRNRYVCQAISSEMARSVFQGHSNSVKAMFAATKIPKLQGAQAYLP